VLTIAGKYLYERKVFPRLWVRATQYDQQHPLRGRYLALQPIVDACGLPRDDTHFVKGYRLYLGGNAPGYWRWNSSLNVEQGRLVPHLQDKQRNPNRDYEITLGVNQPCDKTPVRLEMEYFIPEHARSPFPLKQGQELWVEVTVPRSGPPRPIQLALSGEAGFQPLKFE